MGGSSPSERCSLVGPRRGQQWSKQSCPCQVSSSGPRGPGRKPGRDPRPRRALPTAPAGPPLTPRYALPSWVRFRGVYISPPPSVQDSVLHAGRGLLFDARRQKSDLARQSVRGIGEGKAGKGGGKGRVLPLPPCVPSAVAPAWPCSQCRRPSGQPLGHGLSAGPRHVALLRAGGSRDGALGLLQITP